MEKLFTDEEKWLSLYFDDPQKNSLSFQPLWTFVWNHRDPLHLARRARFSTMATIGQPPMAIYSESCGPSRTALHEEPVSMAFLGFTPWT